MTNHLHLLVAVNAPAYLPDIIRDFKKHTNKRIIDLVKTENESRKDWMLYKFQYHAKYNNRIQDYKVWQDGYHGIECDNAKILLQKMDYTHNNPVVTSIVEEPEHYTYSSAANYFGHKVVLDIVLLDVACYITNIN